MAAPDPPNRSGQPGLGAATKPLRDDSVKPVQRRLLVPLVAVLLLLVCGFVVALLSLQQYHLNQSGQEKLEVAVYDLENSLYEQTQLLAALEGVFFQNASLRDALKAQDTDRLLADNEAVFTHLREEYGITHFDFHGPDRVNLLRMHQPERHGDQITRFTMLKAERTGKMASGIELGSLGTFTLRVVQPVFDAGTLIGYVELGQEIEDILTDICLEHGLELAMTIRKDALNRESWEAGMKMLGREADWNRFADAVIIYSSRDHFPTEYEHLIHGDRGHEHGDAVHEAECGGKSWQLMINPLFDASATEVGDLFIFHEVSEATAWFNRVLLVSSAAGLVLLAVLTGFLYAVLRRVDRGILTREAHLHELLNDLSNQQQTIDQHLIVGVTDIKGTITHVSDRFCEISGYSREELIGQNHRVVKSDEHSHEFYRDMWKTISSGRIWTGEIKNFAKDGSHYWVDATIVPHKNAQGKVTKYVALRTDITALKERERQLRESERGLREAQRIAQVGSWELDIITGVLCWSDEVYKIFGLEPQQFTATYEVFLDAIHPDDRDFVNNAYADSVRNKVPYDIQHRLLLKDGTLKYVNERCETFYNDAGKAVRSMGTVQDITERQQVEEKLRDNSAMLIDALEREKRATSELELAMSRLEAAATTDKLTGLPNRAVFVDRLEQAMKRSKRDGSRFAVLFFDFDRFKVVNDSLGHDMGDALLCDIADIFRREVRESDTIARFGGDEFVLLLDCLSQWSDADKKATRLLDALAEPHDISGHRIVSTASIGLVTNERDYTHPGDMIRDADAAMFLAKADAKERVVKFDGAMHEHAMTRLSLEADLRFAIEEDQLRLVYQPIIELNTGRLTGFEALIRWDHPERGVISPIDFIPIAEETGLIIEIGRWVLRTACMQIADWNSRLGLETRLSMNVNISKRQLLGSSVVDDVLECLREFNLPAEELKLEITESAIADERSDVVLLLTQLREHGLQIAMDDFGTGVSSLSALHEYPIDVLKIDQSFVRSLDGDRSLLAVVASITALAENLRITTVAEGIETADVIGVLQSIGCILGQGYHFAKPMSPSDAEAYLLDYQKQRDTYAA